MIKVFIIEKQQLMRQGLEALIKNESDMTVVGIAETTEEGLNKVRNVKPDVALIDVDQEGFFAIETGIQMREESEDIKVIMLSSDIADESLAFKALSFGCEGYLVKDLDSQILLRSIRDAHQGEMVITGQIARLIARHLLEINYNRKDILKFKLRSKQIELSKREHDVAYLLMEGKANEEISEELGLTVGTIKNYISTIYARLDLHRRKEVQEYLKTFVD